MKTLLIIALFVSFFSAPSIAQTSFTVDTRASQLNWTGYAEIGSWAPTGTLTIQKGQFTAVGKQLTGGRLSIDMATIQHEDGKLQAHLRDEDFFDVARYPTATFLLTGIAGQIATGQLTIRGVTKPVSFPVVVSPEGDGWRIKGKAVIDRTQFAIRYNSTSFFSGLGDYAIKNEFALAFTVVLKPTLSNKSAFAGKPSDRSRR